MLSSTIITSYIHNNAPTKQITKVNTETLDDNQANESLSADASLFFESYSSVSGKLYYSVSETNYLTITGYDSNFGVVDGKFNSIINIDNVNYTLTQINDSAFSTCNKIIGSLTLSDTLINIGSRAFAYCLSLKSITISSSIQTIGDNAFLCVPFSEINLINNDVFKLVNLNHDNNSKILVKKDENPDDTNWNGSANAVGCLAYGKIDYTLLPSITTISNGAFNGCNITDVILSNQIESIGDNAFKYCQNLTYINIPSSVTSIGNNAFACTQISKINLQEGNEVYTLSNLSSGGKILIEKNNLSNNEWDGISSPVGCLAYGKIDYKMYPSVSSISPYMFFGCNISNVTFSSSIISIGDYAFAGCINLSKIEFSSNSKLETIDNSAFRECLSLTSITIPNTVTNIASYSFKRCVNLTSITFLWLTQKELDNLSIANNWFDDGSYNGTIYVPIGTIPLYNQYAEKLDIQNATIKEIPQPKEVNVALIAWLTLWVGLPTIAVIITAMGYYNSIKKHKK